MSEEKKKKESGNQTAFLAITIPVTIAFGTAISSINLDLIWRIVIILFGCSALVFLIAGIISLAAKKKQ